MHNTVLVIGFFNLIVSVVEFLRPDLWEGLWNAWIRHPLFRIHGVLLLSIAVLLAAALPVPRLEWFLWVTIVFLTVTGGTIMIHPEKLAHPIAELYLSQSGEDLHRLTYMDGALRVVIGLCLIFSVIT